MKRNLKFWTRYTWEGAEATLICTAVLAVIALFGADGLDLRTFATVVPYFLCVGAVIAIMLVNTSAQTLYVPLLLSFGETRRNVFLGFHYYRALIIAVAMASCALIWAAAPEEMSAIGLRSIPTLVCVLLIASALGSIMGTLFVRWKWLGTIFIILLCGLAGGSVGFASVAVEDLMSIEKTVELVSFLMTLPWQLIAAVPVALGVDIVFQWMLLRKQEVKL